MKKNKRSTRASSSQSSSKKDRSASNSSISSGNISEQKTWLNWLDENILLILCGFLFAFIPLYPKIPLADLIPGYIVRLRLEDLFVAITGFIFILQIYRKKVQVNMPVTWIIVAYAIVGLLSTISAVIVTQTVPAELLHIGKSALHYFRYLEYFSLLFIAYSAVKKKRDLTIFLAILTITVFAISVYGYGQKYFYWPVYSTMNREFSKGLRLYLTEHARVQSTFGGHYDMAGYLVVALPMMLAWFYGLKKWKFKIPVLVSYVSGLWLLIMSASRTSFIAFLAGMGIVILGFSLIQKSWKTKIWWGFSRSVLMFGIVGYMFMTFGDSIYERFLQTLQAYPEIHNTYHDLNDRRKHFYSRTIQPFIANLGHLNFIPAAQKPENGMSTDELEAQLAAEGNVLVTSDERPTVINPDQKPADVYVDVPDIIYESTVEGGIATVTSREVPRTYSDAAIKHGLSLGIRLDTLWPRALKGFYTNPLLGTGYATLTKETTAQFTEAESTDNNFLRTLGETGLLGFLTFYGVIFSSLFFATRALRQHPTDQLIQVMTIGFVAASIGLLLNAIYIDVYAASKIAFSYWAITGMMLATTLKLRHTSKES